MSTKPLVACLLISLLLSGCASFEPQSTAILPSATTIPTIPAYTDTPAPSLTLTATPMPDITREPIVTLALTVKTPDISLFLPTGRADSEWKGIPIMPNAFAGQKLEDGSGYRFTVKGNFASVERFYAVQLPRLGWDLFVKGNADNGNMLVMFKQGNRVLTLSIIEVDEAERLMMVMIVLT